MVYKSNTHKTTTVTLAKLTTGWNKNENIKTLITNESKSNLNKQKKDRCKRQKEERKKKRKHNVTTKEKITIPAVRTRS